MSRRAAARRYEISESVAIKWLERVERNGSGEPVGHGGHRAPSLALPVSCVLEVCGAFGGRVLGEDFAAGVEDRLVASRFRLSQEGFELGEDLLDGVEVGGVFRQEDEAGSDIPDRLAHRLSLVGAEIVEDHDVARFSVGTRTCST
jgi:hypothetical protein